MNGASVAYRPARDGHLRKVLELAAHGSTNRGAAGWLCTSDATALTFRADYPE
ncbi:hypothetical protein [Plantactinospora soyae]|uniref:Uncharacterized protein n=1 Tax=Plantactinospora soyae TaxID=1544732 RepID=A0A927R9Z2_9ACTN|nr:hypothetical protein [Plantactinospora soyae]MBE1491894.1 hypothetical protein [Plantactinospora soyae]